MAEHTQILLVEGKYDYHLLVKLLERHNLQTTAYHAEKPAQGISIYPMDSKSKLSAILANFVPRGEVQSLGIVVDADQSLESSVKMVQTAVNKLATAEWPPLSSSGLITTAVRRGQRLLRLGLWVMPDNQQAGMLEHFASQLIPPTDQLWPHAQQIVANLPEIRFPTTPNDHTRKSELHTWLAWQKEPGKPMGLAVSLNYLPTDTPLAQTFIQWVRGVFL
ncbi:MAG: hypothetical protein OT477_09600 [Chloroflexi bacterium]|nr:hypothetical protein [Chloroflexota bacterium]